MTGPDVLGTPGAPAVPPGPPGVQARGVRRSFGPVRAVQGVDLEAPPGEVTALVGPNGAGKTTLLLVLATLLRPDAGEVRVAGFDPVSQPAEAPVHSLSRGQKQRLGLARALVHDPSVLLLDEPASGLDPRSRVELRDLLRQMAGEGKTVVVSSHILSDLEEVADRVVFVDAGRTVGQHRIGELPAVQAVRTYRMRALDPGALRVALERERLSFTDAGAANGLDVQITGGDPAAARLLSVLVAGGVPVTAFAPVGGALEATYLDLMEGRS